MNSAGWGLHINTATVDFYKDKWRTSDLLFRVTIANARTDNTNVILVLLQSPLMMGDGFAAALLSDSPSLSIGSHYVMDLLKTTCWKAVHYPSFSWNQDILQKGKLQLCRTRLAPKTNVLRIKKKSNFIGRENNSISFKLDGNRILLKSHWKHQKKYSWDTQRRYVQQEKWRAVLNQICWTGWKRVWV